MKVKFLKQFFLMSFILFIIVILTVILFDPFFHYHKPLGFLKAVAAEPEYQVTGTLRNFEYDSLILGSSLAHNFNNKWFSDAFSCNAIKAVVPSATTADLTYYLDIGFRERELDYIFYTIDPFAITSSTTEAFETREGMPEYLLNDTWLDDIEYLLNADVLFEKIPYLLAYSFLADYDEGESYSWAKGKDFSAFAYTPPTTDVTPMLETLIYEEDTKRNLSSLTTLIEDHPETEFVFLIPPHSFIWWYDCYHAGQLDAIFTSFYTTYETLLPYDNVSIYYFGNEEWIVSDLSNYMDRIHYSPDISHYMVEQIENNNNQLTLDNYEETLSNMRELADRCIQVYAKEYFDLLE